MKFDKYDWDDLGAMAQVTYFRTEDASSCDEWHVMIHVEPRGERFAYQYGRLCQAEKKLCQQSSMQGAQVVFRRYFLSDAANQRPLMEIPDQTAVSIIQQPPLDGSKVAVWLYLVKGADDVHEGRMSHNGYQHLYHWGLTHTEGDSYTQTQQLLEDYEATLREQQLTLADDCIRTWFYVRDVDSRYAGLVKARRENFETQGLTSQTHYIASTGIGGLPVDPRTIIHLDCYALSGKEKEQQRYLYARTHLNPTYEYGVTFERGTVIEYGDRAEVYISGTASIDNKGQVVHPGDIIRQTERMWDNVSALLTEADSSTDDIAQIIVYLRDLCDYAIVKEMFDRRFPRVPRVITLAPVCRPAWLIEMECIAITPRENPQYRAF